MSDLRKAAELGNSDACQSGLEDSRFLLSRVHQSLLVRDLGGPTGARMVRVAGIRGRSNVPVPLCYVKYNERSSY